MLSNFLEAKEFVELIEKFDGSVVDWPNYKSEMFENIINNKNICEFYKKTLVAFTLTGESKRRWKYSVLKRNCSEAWLEFCGNFDNSSSKKCLMILNELADEISIVSDGKDYDGIKEFLKHLCNFQATLEALNMEEKTEVEEIYKKKIWTRYYRPTGCKNVKELIEILKKDYEDAKYSFYFCTEKKNIKLKEKKPFLGFEKRNCFLCKKAGHIIDNCTENIEKKIVMKAILEENLCRRCLMNKHTYENCIRDIQCNICMKTNHVTPMHRFVSDE